MQSIVQLEIEGETPTIENSTRTYWTRCRIKFYLALTLFVLLLGRVLALDVLFTGLFL